MGVLRYLLGLAGLVRRVECEGTPPSPNGMCWRSLELIYSPKTSTDSREDVRDFTPDLIPPAC